MSNLKLDARTGFRLTKLGDTLYIEPTEPVALTDQAIIATNALLGKHFRVTLGGNRTLGNPTNAVDGQSFLWEISQDSNGSRTLSLDSKFALGDDVSDITLSTVANKRDFLSASYNSGTDKFYITGFVRGY